MTKHGRQAISSIDIDYVKQEWIQLPVSCQCEGMIWIINTRLCFFWKIQHLKGKAISHYSQLPLSSPMTQLTLVAFNDTQLGIIQGVMFNHFKMA